MLLQSERVSEMDLIAICIPKLQKFSIWCSPWEYLTEIANKGNSKETESSGENGSRQNCLDKSLTFLENAMFIQVRQSKADSS